MNKIQSLQGLRGAAFLLVFLSHCGIGNGGQMGVSIFLVLSGMLMVLNHYNIEGEPTVKKSFGLAWKRIRKIYPLHIVMTIAALPFLIKNAADYGKNFTYYVECIVSNLLLIQAWFPNVEIRYSMNNLSWYLCVSVFCYFCFGGVCKFLLKKIKGSVSCKSCIILIIAIQFAYGFMINSVINDSEIIKGLIYNFPISRLLDFVIGTVLGKIYLGQIKEKGIGCIYGTLILIVSIFIQVLIELTANESYWWTYVFALSPAAVLLVWGAATDKEGIINKIFTMSLLKKIGNISANLYLIHEVVIRYLRIIIRKITTLDVQQIQTKLIIAAIAMGGSFVFSYIWNYIQFALNNKLQKKYPE